MTERTTGSRRRGVPAGYVRIRIGSTVAVVEASLASAMHDLLARETLYSYAAKHEGRRVLQGRAPAYAVALPDDAATRVVVRHSQHGGLLASFTGDRFLAPTRAPAELRTSLRLRDAGVNTPAIAGYVLYRAGLLLRRSDVATHEVPRSRDLADALADTRATERIAALGATAELLQALTAAGARHPDLNLKNVLLAAGGRSGDAPRAYVLDVDRVLFGDPESRRVARANYDRLAHSARKWRDLRGLKLDEAELEELARAAGVPA